MHSILIIVNALAVLAAITLMFSILSRYEIPKIWSQLILGLMFGIGAVVTLLQPIIIDIGVQVDGRNLFIAFAGAISGILGALVAITLTGVVRAQLGGLGVWAAIASMFLAGFLGWLWAQLNNRNALPHKWRWLILGLMISLSIFVVLVLPSPIGWRAFSTGGPFLLVIYIFGTLLLGWLIENERRFDALRQDLRRNSETDPLTGVLNRRGLFERFHRVNFSRTSNGVAVVTLDLDNFKILNDKFGHHIGDQALLSMVAEVKAHIRSSDLFARLGGDEFLICAFVSTEQEALQFISKLKDKLKFDMEIENSLQSISFSVSVGGLFFERAELSLDQMITAADKEMMVSKLNARQYAATPYTISD